VINLPFVSTNYKNHVNAPVDQWVCTRTSNLGPYASHPSASIRSNPDYCGQCVSYVTTVCSGIPVAASKWKKGPRVRGNTNITQGTAIATFNSDGQYHGHAAIYVSQDDKGIQVYDQWITGAGKAIGPRVLKWGGNGISNNGDGFYVVEA
jgi:hypothetical protein